MGQAAYKTIVKIGGTSTEFTDESTINVIDNDHVIADLTKTVFDRNSEVVVKSDDVIVSSGSYGIDFLFGIIEFNSAQSGAITISGSYIPTAKILGANKYSLMLTGDILENTNFSDAQDNGGFRSKLYGLTDVSSSITIFDDLSKDFKTKITNRDEIMLEFAPAGSTEKIRGWFILEAVNSSGEVNSLEMEELGFQLAGNIKSSFSWREN